LIISAPSMASAPIYARTSLISSTIV
jgi:hypothetical protein